MSKGKLFIISAPSGTGKTTVLRQAMARLQGVAFSISHTTRAPRGSEQDGREYHFINRDTFIEMIDQGLFLEYAEVHDNLYGTSRPAVQDQLNQGVDVILDIDVQGAGIIREAGELEMTSIFLAPPDLHELEKRLRGRGQDGEETIKTRLRNAYKELEQMEAFDYLIINRDLDEAVRMFESVILAERARARRRFDGKKIEEKVLLS